MTKQHSYIFHKCILEKEIDSDLEPAQILSQCAICLPFLTPFLQNRKHISHGFSVSTAVSHASDW